MNEPMYEEIYQTQALFLKDIHFPKIFTDIYEFAAKEKKDKNLFYITSAQIFHAKTIKSHD